MVRPELVVPASFASFIGGVFSVFAYVHFIRNFPKSNDSRLTQVSMGFNTLGIAVFTTGVCVLIFGFLANPNVACQPSEKKNR